jgi:hypothetical protein
MARYCIYEVLRNEDEEGSISADCFYDDDTIKSVSEWIEDDVPEDDQQAERDGFLAMKGIIPFGGNAFKVDKKAYFDGRLDELKKRVMEITDEQFCGIGEGAGTAVRRLEKLVENHWSEYVYDSYSKTLDDFVRSADDEMYYLGNVVEYHG